MWVMQFFAIIAEFLSFWEFQFDTVVLALLGQMVTAPPPPCPLFNHYKIKFIVLLIFNLLKMTRIQGKIGAEK